jgi:cation/acetate symporter
MDLQTWTYIIVGVTFALYIGMQSGLAPDQLKNFMLQEEISPLANGMATAADWMSASFISMAGIISFDGYDGAVYLMGWTGGYVLALLLAPYLKIREIYRSRFYWRTLLL